MRTVRTNDERGNVINNAIATKYAVHLVNGDYRTVLKKLKRHPEDSQAQYEKKRIEKFFREDAGAYMDIDGDYIINRIRKEVDKDERLAKAIQKAKERTADS